MDSKWRCSWFARWSAESNAELLDLKGKWSAHISGLDAGLGWYQRIS
jgi:hypothetical protein